MKFLTIPHKKREREANIISKTLENMSLVTLVINHYKLILLPLKKSVLNFESCYCYFK